MAEIVKGIVPGEGSQVHGVIKSMAVVTLKSKRRRNPNVLCGEALFIFSLRRRRTLWRLGFWCC